MTKVSIVIRCYNEAKHIGKLLNGLTQQTISDIEIIVVDSGSSDDTLLIANRYPVKILPIAPEEFSFGKALNLGCQVASGELIVIASAHVYPLYKDWIEQLVTPLVNSKLALTYGKQRGNSTTKYSEHQVFASWFPNVGNSNQSHPFCNNANAAIRKSLWEQVPYDEDLTGLEDLDWAKRVMDLGYKIAYIPEAEVIHVHDEALKKIYNRYRREAIALKKTFPQEKFTLWDFFRLFIANTFSDYKSAWHDKVLTKNLKSIPSFRLMQFWGTYIGYVQKAPVSQQLRQAFYYPKVSSQTLSAPPPNKANQAIDYKSQL